MATHANSTRTPGRRLLRGSAAPGRLLTTDELIDLLGSRENVEETVERLLTALDEDDGDPELEPMLGSPEASAHTPLGTIDQRLWAADAAAGPDEAEDENEHGEAREAEARELRRATAARRKACLPVQEGLLLQFRARAPATEPLRH